MPFKITNRKPQKPNLIDWPTNQRRDMWTRCLKMRFLNLEIGNFLQKEIIRHSSSELNVWWTKLIGKVVTLHVLIGLLWRALRKNM